MTSKKPSRVTILCAQLGFGLFAMGIGGFFGGEAQLKLTRQDNEALHCAYSFDLFGVVPVIQMHVADLVDIEIVEGEAIGRTGTGEKPHANDSARFIGRSGDSFTIGHSFSLSEIVRMIQSNEKSYEERIEASKVRRWSALGLASFGGLLLLGFLDSLVKILRRV